MAPPTPHDYENLALININRCLATTEGETRAAAAGVTHWRTYSDMANSRHDESTAYERNRKASISGNSSNNSGMRRSNSSRRKNAADYSNCYGSLKYYDIYPLSRDGIISQV